MDNMNVGGFGQKFIKGMESVGKQVSKEWKEMKTEMGLPTKAEVKEKLTAENMKQGAQKLGAGMMKMAKKTAGATFIGLSMITPKKGSESLAPKGMKLLTGRDVGKDYGSYKRDKIGNQAKMVFGKALQHLGKGIETAAGKVASHQKVKADSKLFDAAISIGQRGTNMKFEGENIEENGKEGIDNLKNSSLTAEEKESKGKKLQQEGIALQKKAEPGSKKEKEALAMRSKGDKLMMEGQIKQQNAKTKLEALKSESFEEVEDEFSEDRLEKLNKILKNTETTKPEPHEEVSDEEAASHLDAFLKSGTSEVKKEEEVSNEEAASHLEAFLKTGTSEVKGEEEVSDEEAVEESTEETVEGHGEKPSDEDIQNLKGTLGSLGMDE